MPDKRIQLSRRKVLAGLGSVGLASAGAGMGTTALFSDEESFQNNSLTAGELDLKVDWEEHYSFPQVYGFDDPTNNLDVTRAEPSDPSKYVGLPNPDSPVVWVHKDDLDAYMANTAIEAFPDPDGDGQQELEHNGFTYAPCDNGADLPEDLSDLFNGSPGAVRTDNEDTAGGKPLVTLKDVKPGDHGELTLSFHLCDNPGYVWLQGMEVSESENNPPTEPESVVDNDSGPDLAENIQTVWWYDARGDNVINDCSNTFYLLDTQRGSGAEVTDAAIYEVELDDAANEAHLSRKVDLTSELDDTNSAGHVGASPDGQTLYIVGDNSRELLTWDVGAPSVTNQGLIGGDNIGRVVQVAVLSDGTIYAASPDGLFTIDPSGPTASKVGDITVDGEELAVAGADIAFASDDTLYLYTNAEDDLYVVDPNTGEATPVSDMATGVDLTGLAVRNSGRGRLVGSKPFSDELVTIDRTDGSVENTFKLIDEDGNSFTHNVGDMTVGDICGEVFHTGTLSDDLSTLAGGGIPLDGTRAGDFNELRGDPADPERGCFRPYQNYYVGFGWWVPETVGNEIQGDSVSFDLGFYTEQCRNNDGAL